MVNKVTKTGMDLYLWARRGQNRKVNKFLLCMTFSHPKIFSSLAFERILLVCYNGKKIKADVGTF